MITLMSTDEVAFTAADYDYEMTTESACIAQCDGDDICAEECAYMMFTY